ATRQLRMSPGGSTLNSRRSRPEEPPSSVTVTTPVSCRSAGPPTSCFRPRRSAERPVPPPIATRAAGAGGSARVEDPGRGEPRRARVDLGELGFAQVSGEVEERAELAVLAELGEIGVVEGMDAVLGVQLDRLAESFRRLREPALQRVDR